MGGVGGGMGGGKGWTPTAAGTRWSRPYAALARSGPRGRSIRTEKADPRDHLRGDAGRTGIARDKRFEDHKSLNPNQRDQSIGCARPPGVSPLPLAAVSKELTTACDREVEIAPFPM